MFDTTTQYALNKRNKNAIVYVDVFGEKTEISLDTLGKEEFLKWKTMMDESLHREELENHIYYDHTIGLSDISLAEYAVPDYETILIEEEERREREELKQQVAIAFFSCLTDIQQERLWLHAIDGFSTRDVAELECVAQPAIIHSLNACKKKILAFLQNGGYQNPLLPAYSEGAIN